ncbi:MAG: thiamine pyrophosphate-binding protein, partial [Alphaproteobacteria bacterium]|nr:thiamine pyrophosphate-binding protein [Alphaproteobacteria bacterium]
MNTAMGEKTVWHAVAEALEAEGVEYVFGLPGNPKHLVYDLTERTRIKFVLVRDEQYAVACAYAYARLARKPGVVFSNPGPGVTKLVTGLLEATSASLPVVAITNGVVVAHDGMGAFQELDTVAMNRPITKWSVRLADPGRINWTIQRAFSIAKNGRPGAVYVDVPSDFADRRVAMEGYVPSVPRLRSRPDATDVTRAADLLATAKRPIIVCGSGAVSAGAAPQVAALAEALGAPVFTTPGGRGIYPEDGPLALGQTGLYFTAAGKRWYDSADLLLSVGSRLEAFSTNSWASFPRGARFIQIDAEPTAIGMNWRPDVAVVGDAALALDDIRAALPAIDTGSRRAEIAVLKQDYEADVAAEAAERTTPLRLPRILAEINAVFGRNTVLVKENGGTDLWCYYWPYYRVLDVDCCVPMGEQTAMGFGFAGTIGAKLARPDRKVIAIGGDGAMNMAMMELATAAENRLGITWIVLNNQAFGWPQYDQVLRGKPLVATGFQVGADFVRIAEAQACRARRIDRPEQIRPALDFALAANHEGVPCLLEFTVAKHDYPPHFVAVH